MQNKDIEELKARANRGNTKFVLRILYCPTKNMKTNEFYFDTINLGNEMEHIIHLYESIHQKKYLVSCVNVHKANKYAFPNKNTFFLNPYFDGNNYLIFFLDKELDSKTFYQIFTRAKEHVDNTFDYIILKQNYETNNIDISDKQFYAGDALKSVLTNINNNLNKNREMI